MKRERSEGNAPGGAEQIYRMLFENSRDALYFTTRDGMIIEANQSFIELFGYARDEIVGEDIRKIYANPRDRALFQEEIEARGAVSSYALQLRRQDGTVIDCLLTSSIRRGPGGAIEGYNGIIRDITEIRRTQEDLAQRQRELTQRVKELDCLYEITSVIDRKGYAYAEIVQGVVDLIPQAMDYTEIACARAVLDGQAYVTSPFRQTHWMLSSDITSRCQVVGTVEVFYLEDRPPRDDGPFTQEERRLIEIIASRLGRLYGRKRAEEMLRESEERYRSIFENSRDAIYTTSRDGIFLDANQATLTLFGYSESELIGMNIERIFVDPEEQARFQLDIEARGSVRDYEVRLRHKDGTVMTCLYTSSLRCQADGTMIGHQGIIRDITARKQDEEERLRLIAELTEALEKIRTLRGLVPICASCKKIRDDKGYWNQLEGYIEEHSDAVFSHGLCPECQAKFEEE